MTNEMESSSPWMLRTDKIFKNQVSLNVGAYDTIVVKTLIDQSSRSSSNSGSGMQVISKCVGKETCAEVVKAIDTGMQQSEYSENLNHFRKSY